MKTDTGQLDGLANLIELKLKFWIRLVNDMLNKCAQKGFNLMVVFSFLK